MTATTTAAPLVIRLAGAGDAATIEHLGLLDSSHAPAGPALLAFRGAELQAAIGLDDGHVIADPFRPTAGLVRLLRERARQIGTPAARVRPRYAAARALFDGLTPRARSSATTR